jgi:hypothetical protein
VHAFNTRHTVTFGIPSQSSFFKHPVYCELVLVLIVNSCSVGMLARDSSQLRSSSILREYREIKKELFEARRDRKSIFCPTQMHICEKHLRVRSGDPTLR